MFRVQLLIYRVNGPWHILVQRVPLLRDHRCQRVACRSSRTRRAPSRSLRQRPVAFVKKKPANRIMIVWKHPGHFFRNPKWNLHYQRPAFMPGITHIAKPLPCESINGWIAKNSSLSQQKKTPSLSQYNDLWITWIKIALDFTAVEPLNHHHPDRWNPTLPSCGKTCRLFQRTCMAT